jgi:RNA polymerase sigma-70 factor (ECF subfamily)
VKRNLRWHDGGVENGVDLDGELRALHAAGAFDRVAARALEQFGPELYGFLVHTMSSEADAAEVFSELGESLWAALPAFEFRCSMRTWLYVLVRHAAARFRRSPWQRKERRAGESALEGAIAGVRSRTQPWLRTEVKDQFRALRDALPADDRELLVLRVDRDLAWDDVARVMLGDEAPDTAVLRAESARLRKRYQLVKDELRQRARDAGLVE